MNIVVTGGGFITPSGWGKIQDRPCTMNVSQQMAFPDLNALSINIPSRWGRFDLFTRMGYVSAAFALQDAGYDQDGHTHCGMLISSYYETINTDRHYYGTTLEEDGAFSSPNLFSYTLPVILLGECCSQFHLRGPAFCMGDNPGKKGLNAIKTAIRFIESGIADQMLIGSVEDPPKESDTCPFSIFIFLEHDSQKKGYASSILTIDCDGLTKNNDKRLQSILDLFPSQEKKYR